MKNNEVLRGVFIAQFRGTKMVCTFNKNAEKMARNYNVTYFCDELATLRTLITHFKISIANRCPAMTKFIAKFQWNHTLNWSLNCDGFGPLRWSQTVSEIRPTLSLARRTCVFIRLTGDGVKIKCSHGSLLKFDALHGGISISFRFVVTPCVISTIAKLRYS